MRRTAVRLAVIAAAVLLTAVVVTPASAHGKLVSSVPAQGATLTAPVGSVSLAFTEKPAQFAFFAVFAPSGARVDQPWSHAEPFRLSQPVQEYQLVDGQWQPRQFQAGFPARVPVAHWPEQGAYVVRYQSVASDGEPVADEVSFTYRGPVTPPRAGWQAPVNGPSAELLAAAPAQVPAAAPAPSHDKGPWPWLVPVLLAVAIAGAAALAFTGPAGKRWRRGRR